MQEPNNRNPENTMPLDPFAAAEAPVQSAETTYPVEADGEIHELTLDELIEAARLDNANEAQVLARIMLPMSKPGISAIALLSFVGHWNDYFWPLIMTNSDFIRPITIGVARLKDTEGNDQWNLIMAGNMFLVMPILLMYLFASKYIINSFAYSGIK